MKRISIQFLFLLATLSAIGVYLWPARDVYLNTDALRDLSDDSAEDDANWKTYLGRNDYTMAAWSSIDEANATWQQKRYRTAIDQWWLIAQKYRDTDAALAALDNIARAEEELGNLQSSVYAWEMTLLLPEAKFVDRGVGMFMNFRHTACVKLSKYYEANGNYALAERFVSQAMSQDTSHDTCGVATASVALGLKNRLADLRLKQGK